MVRIIHLQVFYDYYSYVMSGNPKSNSHQPQVLGMNEHLSRRAHGFEELPQAMFEKRLNSFASDVGDIVTRTVSGDFVSLERRMTL